MISSLTRHWPEYLIEAAGLALFMISACLFGTLIEHPSSPVRQAIADPLVRRVLMGAAMGMTAISIIYSPWGKQSGAHINPSVTLTFFRLGKVKLWDAGFYMVAQFLGAIFGVAAAALFLGDLLSDPHVNYVATLPGKYGIGAAFTGELVISFILMTVVLHVSNNPGLHRFTGLCAGFLVANYIAFEAPISGMSMNPARTLGSAFAGQIWTAVWLYFIAPAMGMLLAAEVYVRVNGRQSVGCAKLHHENSKRCIFCGKLAAEVRTLEAALTQQMP
ncbi:MAG TPA: aquaporin [Candidatus Acidoferrales bacterium]|nr:aquaporin [Candidatus Acidoferrales bacterium]